jgi:hypothetical protein
VKPPHRAADSAKPMRRNASTSTAAAIGSLSTSTPLQSKMTNGPSDGPATGSGAVQLFKEMRDYDTARRGDAKSIGCLPCNYTQETNQNC